MVNRIMTCDQEWSYEELYGVLYGECMRACKGLIHLLDNPNLSKPNLLAEYIVDNLGKHTLVDKYNAIYADKNIEDTSDDVFNRWDHWMQHTIQETIKAHKYKGYII